MTSKIEWHECAESQPPYDDEYLVGVRSTHNVARICTVTFAEWDGEDWIETYTKDKITNDVMFWAEIPCCPTW